MVPAHAPKNARDPRRLNGELLTTKALLLSIIAIGIGELCTRDPRVGAAIVAAITVLFMLVDMIN